MLRRRAVLAGLIASPALAQPVPLTIFAASSLTDAMRELAGLWAARGNAPPRLVFAASSTLARQIEQGAPADLFLSADEAWMDYLVPRDGIQPASRVNALGNRLVLIAPKDTPGSLDMPLTRDAILARLGPTGRIASGDPSNVPVGIYAEEALRSLGLWDELAPRLARAQNVRAALLLVERGEAPLGIVYTTDAASSGAVQMLVGFQPGLHKPIAYPFAITRTARPEATALLAFLTGPEAAPVYRRLGFLVRE